jgi:hypothetical protein
MVFFSIHYIKRPGVTLDAGSIIAKLQLDDESNVQSASIVVVEISE